MVKKQTLLYGYRLVHCRHKNRQYLQRHYKKMLKQDLTLQIISWKDELDELDGKIMKEFLGLKEKTYSYLLDNGSEDKKSKWKGTKKCFIKRKLKFEDYKNCLEAAQIGNEINHLEKKTAADSLKEDHKEFIKNNKLVSLLLKAQQ